MLFVAAVPQLHLYMRLPHKTTSLRQSKDKLTVHFDTALLNSAFSIENKEYFRFYYKKN